MSSKIGIGLGVGGGHWRLLRSVSFLYDPGGSGTYSMPGWLAITCASTGRTSQVSASSLRTGFGANAARARSVDGSTFGLSVERAATNQLIHGTMATMSTSNIASTAIVGPDGSGTNARHLVDTSGSLGFIFDGSSYDFGSDGFAVCQSIWRGDGSVTSGAGDHGVLATNGISALSMGTYPTTGWARRDGTGTLSGATNTFNVQAVTDAASQATVDVYGAQFETGKYPTSTILTNGAAATRNADVLSIASPSGVAPGGFFDMTLTFAPNYSNSEQAADHNLLYFGANDRLFLRQSDSKLVLRIASDNVVSSALTWSRNQSITVRAIHKSAGRQLIVSGATTGNGGTTGSVQAAVTLPATAYLLGSNTGAEESGDLRQVRFLRVT